MTNMKRQKGTPEALSTDHAVFDDPRWQTLVSGDATAQEVAELQAWAERSDAAKAAWEAFQPVDPEQLGAMTRDVLQKLRAYNAWNSTPAGAFALQGNGVIMQSAADTDSFAANARARELVEKYALSAHIQNEPSLVGAFVREAVRKMQELGTWEIPHLHENTKLRVVVYPLRTGDFSLPEDSWMISLEETARPNEVVWDEELRTKLGLTLRQWQVTMLLVKTGLAPKQIAAKLGITDGSVRKNIESIYRRLGVRSVGELMTKLKDAS